MSPENGTVLALAIHGMGIYMLILGLGPILHNPSMFWSGGKIVRYGRRHKMAGVLHYLLLLIWIVHINIDVLKASNQGFDLMEFRYDTDNKYLFFSNIILGISGIIVTFSAAYDFRYAHEDKKIKNIASGALDDSSTITVSEMVEHLFYQCLNLFQIIYIHSISRTSSREIRLLYLFLVTLPWIFRNKYFPVNSFSANYSNSGTDPKAIIGVLYRLKKYQYLFYKHFLLHGLNITIAINTFDLAEQIFFQAYWFGLNAAYVMEFFMQTLVKKKYIAQQSMLQMNVFLMLCSTIAAIHVLQNVNMYTSFLSLFLNLVNRNRELVNVFLVTIFTLMMS